jgi:hypothetical protein
MQRLPEPGLLASVEVPRLEGSRPSGRSESYVARTDAEVLDRGAPELDGFTIGSARRRRRVTRENARLDESRIRSR